MALSFPIYQLGNTYVLHVRVAGQQIKRSLRTLDRSLAKVRATQLLSELVEVPPPQNGQVRTDAKFSAQSMAAIQFQASAFAPRPLPLSTSIDKAASAQAAKFKLARIFDEYIKVKKLKEVTKNDYASYAKEMVEFWGNCDIRKLTDQNVTDFIIALRTRSGNDPRTVDNKTGFLRAVINFMIKHGRYNGANPASEKNLVSKREKRQSGTKPFAYNDLHKVFGGDAFKQLGQVKPAIYLAVMTGLVTGMRVSSVGRLSEQDLKTSIRGTHYIDISSDKTLAGNRDIPIPAVLFESLKNFLAKNKGFGFEERQDGKGYSDQINKPLRAYLKASGFDQQYKKMSFHSFRKSWNQFLLESGVERYVCGALLGHVDESMTTGIYASAPSVDFLGEKVIHHQISTLKLLAFEVP